MDGDGRDDVDAVAAAQEDDESNNEEEDLLFINCQTLMDKITASALNPNPNVLHALATILETHETRSLFVTNFLYAFGLFAMLGQFYSFIEIVHFIRFSSFLV